MAIDSVIHKKMFGSGIAALIISNEEINGIMAMVKSLQKTRLLKKALAI